MKKIVKRNIKPQYKTLLSDIVSVMETGKQNAVITVNQELTDAYWNIGRKIIQHEQSGKIRAEYGAELLYRLSKDLTKKYGRGFSLRNLQQMRLFYLTWQKPKIVTVKSNRSISQTVSAKSVRSIWQTVSAKFMLSWSHYIRLLSLKDINARKYYESESIKNGWSVRQLERQINSMFYERLQLSKNKKSLTKKSLIKHDSLAEDEIKDPYILEFLGLKDEYSESDLEEALIKNLENFLLELGGDFAFIGRQKRLRIGNEWYRIDLLFFHRKLKCLVVIDLKIGKFTHADAGQMHMYLNYAKTHWTKKDENPPVGLIMCAQKDSAVAKYSLENLPNKVLAAEYKLALPSERRLAQELRKTKLRIT